MILNKIILIFTIAKCVSIRASLVEINRTQFAKLPALYSFEGWESCVADRGVYCMVDAALVADGTSQELELLKDYSKQTLKHFNRTVIHRGLCVTQCLRSEVNDTSREASEAWSEASEAVREAVNDCVNRSLSYNGLHTSLLSIHGCSSPVPEELSTEGRALGIVCLVIMVISVLATGIHVVNDRWGKGKANKYLISFSVKQSWSILTYDRSRPRTDDRMKDLACLEGIRVIAITCVMFSHVLFIYIYAFTDNPDYIEKMYDKLGWQTMLNSPLWLQGFFSLSSFLMAYSLLISCSESKPFTLVKAIMSVATRWVRLTPLAVFSLWFTIHWFPHLGSGPQWWAAVTREAHDCSQRWSWHLLYVHNHLPTGKFCMGHTWYLAVDMQLHILGVLVMVVAVRWRRLVWPLLAALLLAAAAIPGCVAYYYTLPPIITVQAPEVVDMQLHMVGVLVMVVAVRWRRLVWPLLAALLLAAAAIPGCVAYTLPPIITVQAPESVRTLFAGAETLQRLYLPAYMNLAGYTCGLGAAFLFHHTNKTGTSLADNKLFTLLFHLSLVVGSAVVMSGTIFLGDAALPRWAAALYAALDRTLVAICFNVFMLGCVAGCPSALRSALCWRGFHPLGRLSLAAFLSHFLVLRVMVAADPRLMHASLTNCITLLVIVAITTYIVSVPLCLFIEIPFCQLWRAVTSRDDEVTARHDTADTARDGVKTFDLVAHVSRGQRNGV